MFKGVPLSRVIISSLLAIGFAVLAALPMASPATTAAAGCVRFVASNFDAPGNDNYPSSLNGEWVRIKNFCATGRGIGGWKIHDYDRNHTYTFPSGFRIGPGKTVTLYSGRGSNTAAKRYWGFSYGAVWNNDPPEWASLRSGTGTVVSKWTEY